MTTTTLRRKKADAYSIVPSPVPRYYGFFTSDGDLTCSIYSEAGTWLSDRLATPLTVAGEFPSSSTGTVILTDSGSRVGIGSIAWRSGDAELTVWDVEGDVSYTYTATEGDYVSTPIYRDGWLYWFEIAATGLANSWPAWMLKTRCDLAPADLVTLVSTTVTTDLQSLDFYPTGIRVAATSTHLLMSATGLDAIGGEVEGWITVRCDTTGGDLTATAGGAAEDPSKPALGLIHALPSSSGMMLGIGSNAMRKMLDDLDDLTETAHWPTTGSWAMSATYNFGFSGDGSVATLYGTHEDAATVLEAPFATTGGEPAVNVALANHPDLAQPPVLLYLME